LRHWQLLSRLTSVALALLGIAALTPSAAVLSAHGRPTVRPPATAVPATWATYHHDAQRSGYDAQQPAFNGVKLGWLAPATVDADVYAEPLIVGTTVVVATENNTVYGLSVATGSVLWQAHLGPPVPNSSLPCGNIDPVGITSTPVVDPVAGRLYVVGLVQPSGQAIRYELAAISLSTGAIIYQETLSVSGLDPQHHIQRGALTLLDGYVYIPFGGRYGDCTPYHGWLVGASTSGTGALQVFQSSSDSGGGFWQPAGASEAGLHNLYITSGNTFGGGTYDGGETVFKLASTSLLAIACPISGCQYQIVEADYFAPSNFAFLDANDLDLGSTGPLPVNGGLIFQLGKAGDGYLLRQSSLGHIGGQAYTAHVCPSLTNDAAFGGDAYADPYIYAPCSDGVVALQLNSSAASFAFKWHAPAEGGPSPPIVAGGLVWTFDWAGGRLYALNPTTGATVYSDYIGPGDHFATPAAGAGAVVVVATNQVYAFVSNA
jgi:outer membrane protein assembly factor BamB